EDYVRIVRFVHDKQSVENFDAIIKASVFLGWTPGSVRTILGKLTAHTLDPGHAILREAAATARAAERIVPPPPLASASRSLGRACGASLLRRGWSDACVGDSASAVPDTMAAKGTDEPARMPRYSLVAGDAFETMGPHAAQHIADRGATARGWPG
ncbi:hypothetical protein HK405_002019, partial [Cladochytrium tenue]